MPDIEMCLKTDCPKATQCYRSERSGTQYSDYSQAVSYQEDCMPENNYPNFMEKWK